MGRRPMQRDLWERRTGTNPPPLRHILANELAALQPRWREKAQLEGPCMGARVVREPDAHEKPAALVTFASIADDRLRAFLLLLLWV